MQGDIPSDILNIVARCSSEPDSVSWADVEQIAQFFNNVGCSDLATQILRIKSDAAAGKYEVMTDRDDVSELTLILGQRKIPFPYTHGENLDGVVARLIKKHNLADGHPEGSVSYKKVFKNVKGAIFTTTSRICEEELPRPVYSESHLDRCKNPDAKDGERRSAPPDEDGPSARDVQDSLAEMRRIKAAVSKQNDNKTRTPSRSSSSLSSSTTSTPSRPSSSGNSSKPNVQQKTPSKEKFVLKPPKRLPKRSPQKHGNIGTVASLSKSEEKVDSRGVMRGADMPNVAPSFGGSNRGSSRKRARRDVELRARDIVRMVSEKGYKDMRTKLKHYGIRSTELQVIESRLDAWKTFAAWELLNSRTQHISHNRSAGRAVPHSMIDDEDDDDNQIAMDASFDEDGFVDKTRQEIDEELQTYFRLGSLVWARTPNQQYFRKGEVMDNLVGNNRIRVRFFDGKNPNNKYFVVEEGSSSLRRSQPPLDFIHIDSDDFSFSYPMDTRAARDAEGTTANGQEALVEALTKLTQAYASIEKQRTGDDDYVARRETRRPRRSYNQFGGRTTGASDFSFDFNFGGDGNAMDVDAKTPSEFHLDDSVEKIAVRIRLKSNEVVNAEFNVTHTIGDVRNFLDNHHPVLGSYKLILMGYPRKELTDHSQNVMDAQLKNSQILQR